MTFAAVIVCLLSQAEKVDKPTVELYQGSFVVRKGNDEERLPITVVPKAAPVSVMFRKDQTYAVWDDRGLTIRVGSQVRSTKMPELAVTPKLFLREEILRNLKRFESGERKKEASALSGSRRIGNEVYFLLRWEDRSMKPWLEALVSVDLAAKNPKPKLLGQYEGFTISKKKIDDQLFVQSDKLSAILQRGESWGLGIYDVKDAAFDFTTLGDRLRQFLPLQWPNARFVEDTAYGTTVAGQTNLVDAERKNLAEGRGPIRFLDTEDPPIVSLTSVDGLALRNLSTGAELKLPPEYGARRSKFGILVWSPAKEPKSATLYDPEAWKTTATWAPTSAKTAAKPPT
jgi:hypothetical protein